MKTLTVTEAAKNLTGCVERVYHEHESFELVNRGVPYAHLVPANGTGCNTHELADDLVAAELSLQDRRSFRTTLREGRKGLKPLKNPWA